MSQKSSEINLMTVYILSIHLQNLETRWSERVSCTEKNGSEHKQCFKMLLINAPIFLQHYSAVMKYISQGPMLLDVHMHRPHTNSRNFMDALLAFWPGLQVMKQSCFKVVFYTSQAVLRIKCLNVEFDVFKFSESQQVGGCMKVQNWT